MATPPSILFIHDNFPAQFGAFAVWLAARGWSVVIATGARGTKARGVRFITYVPHREPSPGTHPYAQAMDRAALRGQGFARAALEARRAGLRPDMIVAHTGWGAGMFARDVFPQAAFVAYCEWWYSYPGADVAYLAALAGRAAPRSVEGAMLERARNTPIALDLATADAAICPTAFQAAQFPPTLRAALTVQHDGIDTTLHAPEASSRRSTLRGLVSEDARVVTYATRGMEPHRGFPQFMTALAQILAADPRTVAVVAGENRVAYGGDALRRTDWRAKAMAETDIDPARVHFTGKLEPAAYRALLRRSDAHLYLTVPFVLSWSMLEAMSTGCALVLSDTEPVREFADESMARFADLPDPATIAQAVIETLGNRQAAEHRRRNARAAIIQALSVDRIFRDKARILEALR